jgi:galactose mutarotase-like enzyme
MLTIENEILKAVIHPKGAELTSLRNKQLELEYMWKGDPAFWSKHSPVLFPIVGALKDNTYLFNNKSFNLPRHGFARDKQFVVEGQTADEITFLLQDSEDTLALFPFKFSLRLRYSLFENALAVLYEVTNTGDGEMYFSLGAHPAFAMPLVPGTNYNDYQLKFDKTENAPRWPISKDGLIETNSLPLLNNTNKLPLNKELFAKDAIVFKSLNSTKVSILSDKTPHGLEMDVAGFPYLGIWAAKGADFICIEPWCGIADSVTTNQKLEEKEGINKLAEEEVFTRTWSLRLF